MATKTEYARNRSRDESSKADDKDIVNVIMSGNHVRLKEYLSNNSSKSRFSALVKARSSSGSPLMVEIVKSSRKNGGNADGFIECVRVLAFLDAPLDLQDKNGRTACHWAVVLEQIDLLSELINLGAHVDIVDSDGLNPLHLAINRQSLQCVELLCSIIPPQMKDCLDLCGYCPLFRAICCQSTEIIQCLLFAGCDPNGFGDDGRPLIVHAIEKGNSESLLYLIKHGASVTNSDKDNFGICHLAACQENSACISILCDNLSLDILNGVDQFKKAALMYAAMMGLDKNVDLLLKAKVNEALQDADGKSALHYTSSNTHCGCALLLCRHNQELIHLEDIDGKRPIHHAVAADNSVVVKTLLEAGSLADCMDEKGHTPLHLAVAYGSLECMLILLKMNIDVNVRDQCGAAPLHYSTQLENNEELDKMRLKSLNLLLQVGADIEITDVEGRRPLHWAVTTGNLIACQLIIDAGANPNAGTTKERLTALHLSCSQGWMECVKFLVEICLCNINSIDSAGCSPLFYACATNQTVIVDYLLRNNADPNLRSKDGKSAVHCAAAMAEPFCLQLLQTSGADLEACNHKGETPMHESASSGNIECMTFLIDAGCDLNIKFKGSASPLHYAVAEGNKDIVDIFLIRGAEVNTLVKTDDVNYASPLDVALGNGDHESVSLLQRKGGKTGQNISHSKATIIQSWWRMNAGNVNRKNLSNGPLKNQAEYIHTDVVSKPLKRITNTQGTSGSGCVNGVDHSNRLPYDREMLLKQVEESRKECQLMRDLRAESMLLLEKYKTTLERIEALSLR